MVEPLQDPMAMPDLGQMPPGDMGMLPPEAMMAPQPPDPMQDPYFLSLLEIRETLIESLS